MRTITPAFLSGLLLAAPIAAQHEGHSRHSSAYADQQSSGIAALSAQEVQQLRDGAGMGMARAAELNRYPGPKHVLEMADDLDLSAAQKAAVAATHEKMRLEAMRLGAAILEREEHLQRRFAHRHIDDLTLQQTTAEIAGLYGELRFAHLTAHLETTDLLSAGQIERYHERRGYR